MAVFGAPLAHEDDPRRAEDVEVALVIPVIGCILGLQTIGRLSEIEPERLKRQIFMTLRTVLERRLAQGPLVLVVEDLQWADAASIEGLHTLSDWLCEGEQLLRGYRNYRQRYDCTGGSALKDS